MLESSGNRKQQMSVYTGGLMGLIPHSLTTLSIPSILRCVFVSVSTAARQVDQIG